VNIIEAQVSQARLDGDTFVIPPKRVLSRYTDLLQTTAYQLLELGADWTDIVAELPKMPTQWTADFVCEHCRKFGVVIVDEWYGPVTHRSHTEPIERS